MHLAFVRRAGSACLVALAFALFLPLVLEPAVAAPGVLEACVNPGNGNLRLVDANVACHANETRVQWNVTGPQGPAGPQGPQGPAGSSSGGPPFIWVCTPASYANTGGHARADLYVFNGSAATANVAVHFLDMDGNNLAGVTIPGSSPSQGYPGESTGTTVPLLPSKTRNVTWQSPDTSPDCCTNVSFSIRVVSDQPVAVGTNLGFSGPIPLPCSLLPK
jgi:hypothetical protein